MAEHVRECHSQFGRSAPPRNDCQHPPKSLPKPERAAATEILKMHCAKDTPPHTLCSHALLSMSRPSAKLYMPHRSPCRSFIRFMQRGFSSPRLRGALEFGFLVLLRAGGAPTIHRKRRECCQARRFLSSSRSSRGDLLFPLRSMRTSIHEHEEALILKVLNALAAPQKGEEKAPVSSHCIPHKILLIQEQFGSSESWGSGLASQAARCLCDNGLGCAQ